MRSLTIRPYGPDDKDALAQLWAETFPEDPPWNHPLAMIEQKLAHSPDHLLVGLYDGTIVAAVLAGYDGHRGWINSLAVAKAYRGHALGAAMIRAAINVLNEQGAVKVNLQIRGDNTRLQKYYESLGFVTEDRISMSMMTTKGQAFLK